MVPAWLGTIMLQEEEFVIYAQMLLPIVRSVLLLLLAWFAHPDLLVLIALLALLVSSMIWEYAHHVLLQSARNANHVPLRQHV